MATPLDSIGLSFAPTAQNQAQTQNGGGLSPVQQAIKILSLRIPQNTGPSGISPNALLTGPGSAGLGSAGGGVDLLAFLRRLLQPGMQAGTLAQGMNDNPMAPAMASGVLLPHITPGSGAGPMAPQPGPGVPTFPPTGGGPVVDRSNPAPRSPVVGPVSQPYGGTPMPYVRGSRTNL